jgi:hypothetical protein
MIRGRLTLCAPLCAAAALFFIPQPVFAGKFFFSTSNSINGLVVVSDPVINLPSAGSGTLYIWVTDDTPVTPPPGGPLGGFAAIAYRVNKTGGGSIQNLGVNNFTLHSTFAATGTDLGPTSQNRWDNVTVSGGPDFEANVLAQVSAPGAGSPGLNPLNDGFHLNPGSVLNGTRDPGYDGTGHAFLHGQLDYTLTSGSMTVNLLASPLGIVVGNGITSTDLSSQFTYGFATINVVPEPSSFILMAVAGAIAFAARRRRT